ncbi:hypothetical protein RU349_002318 [Enterobacter kobei]|nr:hypothetical protein [Enterobacter kobei]
MSKSEAFKYAMIIGFGVAAGIHLYVAWLLCLSFPGVRLRECLIMPNPFDAIMFVLLVIGALQGMGWLPW